MTSILSPELSNGYRALRLGVNDVALGQAAFQLMADVFDEREQLLSDAYVAHLLARPEFWAIAALQGDQVVGAATAHVLPMTKSEQPELMLYDIAVSAEHQRRGVGRLLVGYLRELATQHEIGDVFVLADNDDSHALDFYRALGGAASAVTLFAFRARET